MITPGSRPRPAATCAMRCLGVAPLAPKATMWLLMARGAGTRAGHHRPGGEARLDRLGEARATDRRRQAKLVAAGQEDAGRVTDRERGGLLVGLRPGDDVERPDPRGAQLHEDVAVPLARFGAQR